MEKSKMNEHMDHDPLRIVQLSPMADSGIGDYVYRIGQPGEAMGALKGVTVVNINNFSQYLKEMCLCADVLVLHLMGEQDLLPIVAQRKAEGLTTVYEISDNFMAFPSWVSIKPWFSDPTNLATTFQLIRLSDAVQGVSGILLDKFSFLQDRRMVFDNHIRNVRSSPISSGNAVVIGWGGSSGHTEDIKWIAPTIGSICERHPHVRFSFMGNRKQYEEVFGKIANDQFQYREPGDLSDYISFLDELDVGLAPLLNTPYNICRSDVKFIEYASRGVVPVLSDVGPYKRNARHKDNAFLFENAESLDSTLEALTSNPSMVQKMKQNALHYVQTERMEKDHAKERVSFYRGLAGKKSKKPVPSHLLKESSSDADFYRMNSTQSEKKLLKGAYAEAEDRLSEARQLWLEAARGTKNYSFPLFCLGKSFLQEDISRSIDYFHQALTIDPESIRTRLYLGKALKHFNSKEARRELEKSLETFPDFAPAWKEIALMEKEQGDLIKAADLMNRALEANPFYSEAASELGKIYLELEKYDLAFDAFRIAADLLPERIEYKMDVVKTMVKAGHTNEAIQECLSYLEEYPNCVEMIQLAEEIVALKKNEGKASI